MPETDALLASLKGLAGALRPFGRLSRPPSCGRPHAAEVRAGLVRHRLPFEPEVDVKFGLVSRQRQIVPLARRYVACVATLEAMAVWLPLVRREARQTPASWQTPF